MKTICAVFISMLLLSSNVAADEFISGMDDIPLPSGMRQIHSADISFGNDEIRFNEAYITSERLSFSSVAGFYKETLPQLGWKFNNNKENALHFERDMEVLDIVAEKMKPLLIRITLKSKD